MSRASSLARAIGSDGTLNVADVAGLAAVASSGSASDLGTGTLPIARIADGAVATAKIADAAITTAKIAEGAVVTADIADSAVTAGKLHTTAVTDKLGYIPTRQSGGSITVGGDANTFYPVAFNGNWATGDRIKIMKYVHDYATGDGILEFEAEIGARGWGSFFGKAHILRHRWSNRNFIADWATNPPTDDYLVVWLRGGGRLYSFFTTSNQTATVYLSSTDLGFPPSYSWTAAPRTTVDSKALVERHGYDSTFLNIDPSGRVTIPNQPAFQAYMQGGSGNISTGNKTVWTAKFNRGGHFSDANDRFTAPVSGVYWMHASFHVSGVSSQARPVFRVNGADYDTGGDAAQTVMNITGTECTLTLGIHLPLTAGDFVEIWARTGGGTISVYTGHTWWSGHLVG